MKYIIVAGCILAAFSSLAAEETVVVYPSTDRSVNGTDADYGVTLWGETDQTLEAGDTAASNEEVRGVLEFDLSAADIADATNISLCITVAPCLNIPFDWVVMHMESGNDGTVTAGDYQAFAAQISPVYPGTTASGTAIVLDVTALVKADALSGDWTAFRIQVSDPNVVSDGDGIPERAKIWSGNVGEVSCRPQLIIKVP